MSVRQLGRKMMRMRTDPWRAGRRRRNGGNNFSGQMPVGITKRRFGWNLKWFHHNLFLFQDHWFGFLSLLMFCRPWKRCVQCILYISFANYVKFPEDWLSFIDWL